MADNENTILTEENESTRIINLSEASEMDAGMYFVTDSSNGTRKVPITKLIDADLENEYAAAPAKEVGDLKEDLSDIFTYSTPTTATPISSIDGIYTRTGWNASDAASSIAFSSNASYDSYWFVTANDVDVWFDDTVNASYLALIVGGAYQYSQEQSANAFYVFCENGSTRYRKSEGNLPTENNKMHIDAGCAVAFTITAGAMESCYGLSQATEKTVKESFKAEIVKRNYLKYVSGNGADASTEKVEIYIPTASGYVRYDFLHTVSQAINSDVWRLGYAYHTDDDFVANFSLTTAGEWEGAIKLDGRDDFSGGYAHGDEVMNNVLFIVDGVPVDMTTLTTMTAFDDLCIIEDSDLYDPTDHTTIYANHGSEHHFASDGLTIRQSVKFIIAETVVTAYLAMFPIAKAVSNLVVPDNTFVPLSTDSAIRIYDTEKAVIYKTDGKVKAEFSIPIWDRLASDGFTFMCLDNGTTDYNKCYFVNTLSSVSVPQNKLLKTETRYNFVVGD